MSNESQDVFKQALAEAAGTVPDALHIHFNGAGGNVAAGKYNDGSHENRLILAKRLADGMKRAWRTPGKRALPGIKSTERPGTSHSHQPTAWRKSRKG
ncbi:MAG: hypothetical protein QM305_10440 [Bacteroidota bacterium]|nr:hypothetical protein [Bacteroidota bacterium]